MADRRLELCFLVGIVSEGDTCFLIVDVRLEFRIHKSGKIFVAAQKRLYYHNCAAESPGS